MAVVNIREVYPGVSLGLWQMDEEVEQLFEQDVYKRQEEILSLSSTRRMVSANISAIVSCLTLSQRLV